MVVPCKECITLAICRHKTFSKLLTECRLIRALDEGRKRNRDGYFIYILAIEEVVNPTGWSYKGMGRRYKGDGRL